MPMFAATLLERSDAVCIGLKRNQTNRYRRHTATPIRYLLVIGTAY